MMQEALPDCRTGNRMRCSRGRSRAFTDADTADCFLAGHQSLPGTFCDCGLHTASQVAVEIPGATFRTLPSPRPTSIAPLCGDVSTSGRQFPAPGLIWNGRLP